MPVMSVEDKPICTKSCISAQMVHLALFKKRIILLSDVKRYFESSYNTFNKF